MLQNIQKNWRAGLTVALVSIPLSVALAVASNTTPAVGIITAIWAGLFAALFGGSQFNIVGPTGALSGLIASFVILNGAEGLPMLALLVGILILVSYFLHFERFLILIPASVIHGFTLGVAFIIGLGQASSAFGLQGLKTHESFVGNLFEVFTHLNYLHWPAFLLFIVFLAGLILFKKFLPKVPGVIALAPFGLMLGYWSNVGVLGWGLETLGTKFGDIKLTILNLPNFYFSYGILSSALVIALVAILETMLSAKIADKMTKTKHNERKEILGLSLANIASGLFGGMPATAALARTSLNVKAGAVGRTSGVLNAIFVFLISIIFLRYFKFMPMSVTAAILVFVAINMIDLRHFYKLLKYEKAGFYISILVAILVVVEDPMVAILVGVSGALLIQVYRISQGFYEIREESTKHIEASSNTEKLKDVKEIEEDNDILLYSFKGRVTYINAKAHVARFEKNLVKYKVVILRFREVHSLDLDGIEAIDEIIGIIKSRGQKVLLTSVVPLVDKTLMDSSFYFKDLKGRGLVFAKTQNALEYLGIPLKSN